MNQSIFRLSYFIRFLLTKNLSDKAFPPFKPKRYHSGSSLSSIVPAQR